MVVVPSRGGGGNKVTSTTAKLKEKEKIAKKEKESSKKLTRKDSSTSVKLNNGNKSVGKKKEDVSPRKVKATKITGTKATESSNATTKEKEKHATKSRSSSPSVTSTKSGSSTVSTNKKITAQNLQQHAIHITYNRTEKLDNMVATLSATCPRIQAQRKFAQAGNIYTGFNFNQTIPSNSPYATPSKKTPSKRSHEGANGSSSAKKVKTPMFSPQPCERPKTSDFLTFLCVRGTPELPPELEFFKFPQVLETEAQIHPKKKIFSQSCTQSTNTVELKEFNTEDIKSDNPSQSSNKNKIISKLKAQSKLQPTVKIIKCSEATKKSSTSTTSVCKAENPTKGIRATGIRVLFSKLKKTSPVIRTRPIISPPRSRLNEQDARFAMTALKLKYQRLAVNKSTRSAILTKKAKESIILTRSKSRTSYSHGKLPTKKGRMVARTHPVIISPSRNAPSPDIIFGVTCTSAARKRAVVSSSDESESNDDVKNDASSEEESNDSESEPAKEKDKELALPLTRSLRNGKELTRPKSKSPLPEKKYVSNKMDKMAAADRRVGTIGTRSAHRMTKSPLREIPMYKPKKLKRKLLKKVPKSVENKKDKDKIKDKKNGGKDKSESKEQISKKADAGDSKRPSRKTKENATNLLLLGLLTLSTDDDDSGAERQNANNEDSEVGSSSSSEAHYLEKHYTAALRREEEKFSKNKKNKSEMRRRSSRRDSSNISNKSDSKSETKIPGRKLRSKRSSSNGGKSERKPCHRGELNQKQDEGSKSRTRHGTPTVGDRKMPGAARKSASVTCRGTRYSSSENGNSSSDEIESGNSSDEDDLGPTETKLINKSKLKAKVKSQIKTKKASAKQMLSKKSKLRKSDYSDDVDEQSENELSEKEQQESGNETSGDESEADDSDGEPDSKVDINSHPNQKCSKTTFNKCRSEDIKSKRQIKRERSSSLEDDSRRPGSPQKFEREESVETEQCKLSPRSRLSRSRSRSGSDGQSSNHVEKSSSSEDESALEGEVEGSTSSGDEDDGDQESIPDKVDMSTQVDMDEEEGIATSTVSLAELAGLVTSPKKEPKPSLNEPKTSLNEDSDDDVQEIGQVFASHSTSTSSTQRHVTGSQRSSNTKNPTSSDHSARTQGTSSSSSPFFHQPPTPPFQQSQFHHTTPIIDPLHNNPFNPFLPPPSRPVNIQQDFYTPLQLGPPLVQSSFQLVGSTLGMGGPSFPVANPLNTLSIPVSVPFSTHHLLPHHPSTIGFASGSTFHATTMQTHIRSVATDIPLVRPIVGLGGDHHHSSSINFMPRGLSLGVSSNTPLTRPPSMGLGVGLGGVWGHQSQIDPNATSRNHYSASAFRVPHLSSATHTTHTTQHVIHHQSTTVLGMNSTPALPVSIIQPQAHQYLAQNQPNLNNSQSQPGSSYYPQHYPPSTSKPGNSKQKQNTSSSSASNSSTFTSLSATTSQRPKSPTPPGYHLIKHLPNVSIVPKFDRNLHSSNSETGSSSKKERKNGTKNTEGQGSGEKKKVGRKKKESVVLPHPSSPLTVRKDSNPSTYAPKKVNKIELGTESCSSKEDRTRTTDSPTSLKHQNQSSPILSSTKLPQKDKNEVGKLVKKKKETSKDCVSPVPSCSSTIINAKRDKNESPKANKTKKDKEAGGSSKSHSNPPSRTSSPNVPTIKCKSVKCPDEANKNGITDAPTFHPSDQEFEDPLKYIQKIQPVAEKYGIARIVPPKSFFSECNVKDEMRFPVYHHYIHKMYQRWGPNVLESEAIKQNLKQSKVDVSESLVIGGMEINLSTLYQTVKSFGGLKEVMEKQRFNRVADTMSIPKGSHDRAHKLDAICLKYLLPYDTLSDGEREKLKKKVEKKWTKRREAILAAEDEDLGEDSMDELDECIVKGKITPLSTYYRVARNTSNLFFPAEKEHSCNEIEEEYWKIVRERNRPVCVYSGSIDCAGVGWGFPTIAADKHPWNLKVLANNQSSVLRSMGPVMGATVPTLHVSMLFTSYCWYRDPHSLPWVEYLHSGANKIWYSVAAENENLFRSALTELMPMQCKKKKIWLASDSAMVPPELLVARGVPLVRMVQNPGEFLVVFPKAYTSAICTGYLISESVCFAYPSWLQTCIQTFKEIRDSKEPPVFPLEKLLLSILQDARASLKVVRSILPATKQLIKDEIALRKKITLLGVKFGGKISSELESDSSKKKKAVREEEMEQCYNCNYTLHLSMVRNLKSDLVMCLKHALEHFTKHKADIKKSNLLYDLDEVQLDTILENVSKRCGNVIKSSVRS